MESGKNNASASTTNNNTNPVQAIEKLQLLQRVVESQKVIAKLTSRCYKKCILDRGGSKGAKSLTNKERQCLWDCAQNFLESSEFISSKIALTEDATPPPSSTPERN